MGSNVEYPWQHRLRPSVTTALLEPNKVRATPLAPQDDEQSILYTVFYLLRLLCGLLCRLLGREHNLLPADGARAAADAEGESISRRQLGTGGGELEEGPRGGPGLGERNIHLCAEDAERALFGVDRAVQRQRLEDALVARQVQIEVELLRLERDI